MRPWNLKLSIGIAFCVLAFGKWAAFGAIPQKGAITDDTALLQRVTEIKVRKEATPSFDSDIARLKGQEARYREKLQPLRAYPSNEAPLNRMSQKSG